MLKIMQPRIAHRRSKFNKLYLLLIVLFAFSSTAFSAATQPPSTTAKVTFISPGPVESPFFKIVTDVMQAAADNLNLELDVVYGNSDPKTTLEVAQAVFARAELPHYLVLINRRGVTANIMRQADKLGIYTILFNGEYPDSTFNTLRYGPDALQHWIGQILPNEVQSGHLLAKNLITAARRSEAYAKNGTIQMLAINGRMRTSTTRLRDFGMRSYVASQPDVNLQSVVHADWQQKAARLKTAKHLQQHRDTTVIWSASNLMAIGAAQASKGKGLTLGKDIFIGGIDWLPVVFEPMRQGQLLGSVGGHIFDGAWSMVLAYDHFNGQLTNFVDERTDFYFAGKHDVETVSQLMSEQHWREIDFSQFSRRKKGVDGYHFGPQLLLADVQNLSQLQQ